MRCPNCKHDCSDIDEVCPECGEILSVADDKMDAMVQAASIPSLGALFQSAKDKGLIQATIEYSSST